MSARISASFGLAAVIACVMASPASALRASAGKPTPGQTSGRNPTSAQATSQRPPSAKAPAKTYSPPRTPWGDPDLQGNYTNKYEQGTPFERPDEFAGRQIEDLKNDELKDILQERQDRALLSITLAGGLLFISSDAGVTLVLEPGREYKEVAKNTLEPFRSTPVFQGKRLYIRAKEHLYCIGE